ncbi:hypothetical protein G5574_12455 [Pantoea stewartii]|uniref:hypothetical protein n=1 Tax=Pantoea stewartii TaxID=66269 RepID=UPI0013DDC6C6|nr:hypothetical protein [Pantoea stewartii]QIE97724.1 hypothetical protein G5574_12455 [Pantoea stewartii]
MDKQTPIHLDSELYGLETIIKAAMEMSHLKQEEYEMSIDLLEVALQRCRKIRGVVENSGVKHG